MNFPLVGNSRIKNAITNMMASGKIPHAILIEGEAGCGKTTLAHYLCSAVLCESNEAPCGVCTGCRLFLSGNHPDIEFVEPEKDRKTISVNRVREIVMSASIVPQTAAKRVFLIDNADLMTVQAQNALLKILEEPPETTVFILTCPSRATLLQTVVSRCTILTVAVPDEQTATEYIKEHTNKEMPDIINAFRSAHGGIGTALNILKRKSAGTAADLAYSFTDILQNGSQYELLKLLLPLEKNRQKTLDFYNALEVVTVSLIRESRSKTLVRKYERLYDIIAEHKTLLKSNANLSLLLTSLAVAAAEKG